MSTLGRFGSLLLTAALGAASGCFSLPADDVTFTCDFEGAASCPDGYSCEVDGCCHRDGSKVDAALGECRLGGTGGTGFSGTGDSGTDDGDSGTGDGDSGTGDGGTGDGGTGTGG